MGCWKKITFLLLPAVFLCFLNEGAENGFIYPHDAGRDPLESLLNADGTLNRRLIQETSSYTLQGIIYDTQGKSYAVINNVTVREGDFIGDATIATIEKERVVLSRQGQEIVLNAEENND